MTDIAVPGRDATVAVDAPQHTVKVAPAADPIAVTVTGSTVTVTAAPAQVVVGHSDATVVVAAVPGGAGVDGTDGGDGTDGKSAYQLATNAGFVGTEAEWLASLHGQDAEPAEPGDDGRSAYQIALDNGFVGTVGEWLASLKGQDGQDGDDGPAGYTPPFIFLPTRWTSDFGNGLDGRVPAISLAATGLNGGYVLGGPSPWTNVDVYIAWAEHLTASAGNVVFATYFGSAVDGARTTTTTPGKQTVAATGATLIHHETLAITNATVPTNRMLAGAVARYGDDGPDTYPNSVGLYGLIIRPHT